MKIKVRNSLTKKINAISMFLSPLQHSMCIYAHVFQRRKRNTQAVVGSERGGTEEGIVDL